MLAPFYLIILACVVAGPVLALIALSRINRRGGVRDRLQEEEGRLEAIETRLAALQRRLVTLERAVSGVSPAAPAPGVAPTAATTAHAPAGPFEPPPDVPFEPPSETPSAPPFWTAPPPGREASPPIPPEPPQPPAPSIDWERWLGIRGAAVVGAVALGLAGLLFFKYSIEQGLITPAMRVVLGTLTGLGCLVGAEWLRARGYRQTAEGISGGGVVILYAAFWAASVLYGLIGLPVAFILMVLVTAASCLLAVRHASLVIAVLGLVGGFATPLLLSSGADRPIGLFGYVLLLDLGLLAVGRKRAWPSLGLLALLGTVLMQGLWIFARMGPERLFLGLAILVVFALLFVVFGRMAGGTGSRLTWLWSQIGAIAFPFIFALYFAARVGLGPHLYPIAILLALLGAGASWIASEQGLPQLGVAAATASVVVVAVWLLQHSLTAALAWETVASAAGLALVFHLFVERNREPAGFDGPAPAAMIAACGTFGLLVLAAAAAEAPITPWLAGWAALAGLLYRHAAFPRRGVLQLVAACGIGLGLTFFHLAHFRSPDFPGSDLFLALLIGAALALQTIALLRRDTEVRRFADHAAALLPVLLLLGLTPARLTRSLMPPLALGTALILGVLVMLAATRLKAGRWCAAAVGATLLAQTAWTAGRVGLHEHPREVMSAFLVQVATVLVFTAWPLLASRQFAADRPAWRAAALAGPLWFGSLRRLFVYSFGSAFIGALPIALGALSLFAADRARRTWPSSDPVRKSAIVWFAAVALCFVAVAIPLQLDKEWITLGWALEGLAVIALWTRLDHPGLKYFGLALLAATTVRLVFNVEILGYYPRSAWRIVNWLMYTYLVPAAALLQSAAFLKPRERERARPWETAMYAGGHPVGAVGAGVAAILVIFVWINLAIADWFTLGTRLTVELGGPPAQRLTVSIAWGIYALLLLGFGMARDSSGLRWVSLCFLLITIGKVFLYDLGTLTDLYRVASLVGLAVSLILVSLLYQRFVFRKERRGAS